MTNLDILILAIRSRKPIRFEYNKEGKVEGERIGNPHAIFIHTAKKTQVKSTKVHIVQTSGVSDSENSKPFPDFRMFNIESISNLSILKESPCFEPFYDKYNSEWDGYCDIIEKI